MNVSTPGTTYEKDRSEIAMKAQILPGAIKVAIK